ncbi:MAG: acyltransferase [Ferruginibacter sp.]
MGIYLKINSTKERFPALTGIRAAGAAAVFFVHLPFKTGLKPFIDVMALMTFFFVISGFLIFYLYYENAAVKSGKLKQYFVNRFARIYPVYFLLVSIAILISHDYRAIFLFKNYTLTHALFYNQADRAIQQSWSLTVEECFYLLAPLIMYLVRKFNFATALLFGCSLLGAALIISTLPISLLHTPRFVFSITFFGHFFEFFCGIFLALLILERQKENGLFLKGKKYSIVGGLSILALFGFLIASDNMHAASATSSFIFVNNFILPILIAIFFYGLMLEKTVIANILSSGLMRLLGRTSYAFYLVHAMVIEFIADPFIAVYFKANYNLYVLFVFAFTQLIAFFIFIFYEQPLNRFIRNKFAKAQNQEVAKTQL